MAENPTPVDCGAVGDGTLHTVDEWLVGGDLDRGYNDLAAIQVDYPFVTALTDSVDYAGIQQCIDLGQPQISLGDLTYHVGTNTIIFSGFFRSLTGGGAQLRTQTDTLILDADNLGTSVITGIQFVHLPIVPPDGNTATGVRLCRNGGDSNSIVRCQFLSLGTATEVWTHTNIVDRCTVQDCGIGVYFLCDPALANITPNNCNVVNSNIRFCTYGIRVKPDQKIFSLFVTNSDIEACTVNEIYVEPGNAFLSHFILQGVYLETSVDPHSHMQIEGACDFLSVNECEMLANVPIGSQTNIRAIDILAPSNCILNTMSTTFDTIQQAIVQASPRDVHLFSNRYAVVTTPISLLDSSARVFAISDPSSLVDNALVVLPLKVENDATDAVTIEGTSAVGGGEPQKQFGLVYRGQFSSTPGQRTEYASILAEKEDQTAFGGRAGLVFKTSIGTTGDREVARITPDGEIEMLLDGAGFILRSPDGTRYRTTVDNAGVLQTAAV